MVNNWYVLRLGCPTRMISHELIENLKNYFRGEREQPTFRHVVKGSVTLIAKGDEIIEVVVPIFSLIGAPVLVYMVYVKHFLAFALSALKGITSQAGEVIVTILNFRFGKILTSLGAVQVIKRGSFRYFPADTARKGNPALRTGNRSVATWMVLFTAMFANLVVRFQSMISCPDSTGFAHRLRLVKLGDLDAATGAENIGIRRFTLI